MLLPLYIKELLYQHECVTIPHFGAFLTHTVNAWIQQENGIFNPPKKEVSFNRLLSSNDGVLAHYMAQKEKISFESALRKIEKEVIVWKQRLNTQPLTFPGVGEIRLNAEKKFVFSPYGGVNFDLTTFGLGSFIRKPLYYKSIHVEKPKTSPIMENENKENLMFTPQRNKNTNKPSLLMRYAAIGVIGIALVGVIYYFGDQYVTSEKAKATKLAQKKIETNVQEATFDLGSMAAVELNLNAQPEVVDNTPLAQPYYSVIAGSYRLMENANNKLAQLKAEGFDAAFTEVNPEGLLRVAYGRFTSKREALNLLNYIRITLKEEAWYLEEK